MHYFDDTGRLILPTALTLTVTASRSVLSRIKMAACWELWEHWCLSLSLSGTGTRDVDSETTESRNLCSPTPVVPSKQWPRWPSTKVQYLNLIMKTVQLRFNWIVYG